MNTDTITDRISRIKVRLPNNPLKSLNSYIVRGDNRNLLIDTGFHLPESFSDLREGISAFGIDMGRTDVFLTHCHADHAGNAGRIASPDSAIYASAVDKPIIEWFIGDNDGLQSYFSKNMLRSGFPDDERIRSLGVNPAVQNNERASFAITPVGDNHVFDLGGICLRAFYTPGHTPGHMCLSVDDEGILFTGDHVLFDITPNITEWRELSDALGAYLESLRGMRGMDVRLALPAHRERGDFKTRVEQLLLHHENRLAEVLDIVAGKAAQSCYEIASRMTWRISDNNWSAFPLSQKYFAVGEARSHLRHLEARGNIRAEAPDGVDRFFVKSAR
jgi:glyoxylase-like metal-dependent hydrolase (beta-lactamase superfamily II)